MQSMRKYAQRFVRKPEDVDDISQEMIVVALETMAAKGMPIGRQKRFYLFTQACRRSTRALGNRKKEKSFENDEKLNLTYTNISDFYSANWTDTYCSKSTRSKNASVFRYRLNVDGKYMCTLSVYDIEDGLAMTQKQRTIALSKHVKRFVTKEKIYVTSADFAREKTGKRWAHKAFFRQGMTVKISLEPEISTNS